uniref:Pancreatic trypsin inhibitor n=1 Tax=Rhipicephalus appendiculatus TaxID=34631 RepID=A0A131YEG8_RHIAP
MKFLLLVFLTVAVISTASLINADKGPDGHRCQRPKREAIPPGKGPVTGAAFNATINVKWGYNPDDCMCSRYRWHNYTRFEDLRLFASCRECTLNCTDKEPEKECEGFD